MVICFPLKCKVESEGVNFKGTGGIESLGPPLGGIIFAQPELIITLKAARTNNVMNSMKNRTCIMKLQT